MKNIPSPQINQITRMNYNFANKFTINNYGHALDES
jgi:hypothetical protein